MKVHDDEGGLIKFSTDMTDFSLSKDQWKLIILHGHTCLFTEPYIICLKKMGYEMLDKIFSVYVRKEYADASRDFLQAGNCLDLPSCAPFPAWIYTVYYNGIIIPTRLMAGLKMGDVGSTLKGIVEVFLPKEMIINN